MAAEIRTTLAGTWLSLRAEKIKEYLDAVGVNPEMKEAVLKVDPTLIITVDDDLIGVEVTGGKVTVKNTFKLGEEFDANTGDVPAKGLSTFSDGKLRTVVTPTKESNKQPMTVIREMVNGELVQTMIIGDVTAKRFFKKA